MYLLSQKLHMTASDNTNFFSVHSIYIITMKIEAHIGG